MTSQTHVSFAFKTQIEICLKIKHVQNAKIYEDKRDLYCIYKATHYETIEYCIDVTEYYVHTSGAVINNLYILK